MEERFDGKGALRDVGGVLEQGDITGREGRGSETEELPVWEIPGHDGENARMGPSGSKRMKFWILEFPVEDRTGGTGWSARNAAAFSAK